MTHIKKGAGWRTQVRVQDSGKSTGNDRVGTYQPQRLSRMAMPQWRLGTGKGWKIDASLGSDGDSLPAAGWWIPLIEALRASLKCLKIGGKIVVSPPSAWQLQGKACPGNLASDGWATPKWLVLQSRLGPLAGASSMPSSPNP